MGEMEGERGERNDVSSQGERESVHGHGGLDAAQRVA